MPSHDVAAAQWPLFDVVAQQAFGAPAFPAPSFIIGGDMEQNSDA